jgi:hypothetical protein
MAVLAYGAKKVRSLELALGGKPPGDAVRRSLGSLRQVAAERFKRREVERVQLRRVFERARAPIFESLRGDERVLRSSNEFRAVVERRSKQTLRKRSQNLKSLKIEPRVIVGSSFWLNTPPYDTAGQGGNPDVTSDAAGGTYSWAQQSLFDAGLSAWAGVASWFWATDENPQQRFAALLDYSYAWWDSAAGYTAHTDASTALWVWGANENGWVGQQGGLYPSWSDGAGWFDDHNGGDDGRESLQAFFPVGANGWYLLWVWSSTSLDSDSGFFGGSASSSQLSVSVPMMVFGSL